MKQFILIYNRNAQELEEVLQFNDDVVAATRTYGELERENLWSEEKDIVLLGSDSLDTLRKTHGNYFTGNAYRQVNKALELARLNSHCSHTF